MTIEERAKKYARGLCEGVDNFEDSLIYQIHYDEYIEIATEQRKIDIEKACEWWLNQFGGKFATSFDLARLNKFKQAMEK